MKLLLKRGREKPVLNRHPWIFSGAIAGVENSDNWSPGDVVDVHSYDGRWLCCADYSPHSQIRARALSWKQHENIGREFFSQLLEDAIALRKNLNIHSETNAFRLINAEADRLPGLIVDRYEEFVVVQYLTQGMDARSLLIEELLDDRLNPGGIYERSDTNARSLEGLKKRSGTKKGSQPPPELEIHENGLSFYVDIAGGHKTGFYIDQRENRAIACSSELVFGKTLLNVFSYTGGFAVYAVANGAQHVTNIDSSSEALDLARRNISLNAPGRTGDDYLQGDAFQLLRSLRDSSRLFDLIILDPPKFAHKQKDIERACRGYKDLNLLAMQMLAPGGILATFSCSGLVSADLFQKVLFGAAIDAGRSVQIFRKLGQSADHPVLLTFPESEYLKGFLCRVV